MVDETNLDINPDEDFAKAFADLAKEGAVDEPAAAAPPAEKPAERPAGAATAADNPPAGDQPVVGAGLEGTTVEGEVDGEDDSADADAEGDESGEGVKGEDQPKPKPETPVVAPAADDPIKRLADTLAERLAPTEQPKPQPQPQPEPQEVYTAEEKAVLAKYVEEYPEIAAAERLSRRQEYQTIIAYTLNEVVGMIAPVMRAQQDMLAERHLQNLQTGIPDYSDELVDKVAEWADKQPSYLRKAYLDVIQNGDDQDVKDLVARYKAETGTPQMQKPAAPAAPAAKPELPAQAKKAAAALAPVRSQRSGGAPQVQPTGFDDAFAQFAKET